MSWISEQEIVSLIKAKYTIKNNDANIPQELLQQELSTFEKRDKVDGDPSVKEIEWEYYFDPK
jgi:hypothetical protein